VNISEHKAQKSQDTREITKQPQTKFKQPTQEEHVRNRPVNDLINVRQKIILDKTTTFSTYPPLVPTVLPFSTLATSTLPTPIPTKYKQPMTRQSAINRSDQTQNQQIEKVPIRKIVYSNPPPRPFASVSIRVGSSNPEFQEDVSRNHKIVTSNKDIISKPMYVMNRLVPTTTNKVQSKYQKQKPSSTIQLQDEQDQYNENKLKKDKQNSTLSIKISRVHESKKAQLFRKQIQTPEDKSIKNKPTEMINGSPLYQPYKPWIPINQDHALLPIKQATKTKPLEVVTKSLHYKTPKLLRHPSRNPDKYFPANMIKMLYTFNPSGVEGNSLSNPESNITSGGNQADATTTTENQATNAPQHKQATYGPQTKRKGNHNSVLTIQQMQRKELKSFLSLPQNNDVIDISEDSGPTIVKVTEKEKLNDKTEADNNESKVRLSFNIPCARSARYDLILGFKFCV
jgi:hypothetical protein